MLNTPLSSKSLFDDNGLTTAFTGWPLANSAFCRCWPMKPVAPVSSMASVVSAKSGDFSIGFHRSRQVQGRGLLALQKSLPRLEPGKLA